MADMPAVEESAMLTRRRFLSIAAAAAALPWDGVAFASTTGSVVWRGTALGAEASIRIVHPDRAFAEALIARCVTEIDRLEGLFSLYRGDSALVRLNGEGVLREPPLEFVELLWFALSAARQTDGAFDPTVQPLFRLYADHFAAAGAAAEGPPREAIVGALDRVGHRHVEIDADEIRLTRPGMGVTLNGIAQGYVTDRVADLLKQEGLSNVLLDLGEIRALGTRGDGDAWRVAVADPRDREARIIDLHLSDGGGLHPALSTSAGYGTRFDEAGRHHHLFDPRTGRSANRYLSVSVAAERAVVADALSTALSVLPQESAAALLERYRPARAWLVSEEKRVARVQAD
jgi:thiamine biosynthesis lipoprotein